jgi:hypothetical protein
MPASDFVFKRRFRTGARPLRGLLTGAIGLAAITQAVAGAACKPALAFTEARFSKMRPPTMERTWTATLSVVSSTCTTTSGPFEIMLTRQKENGPEIDFVERFSWKPGRVDVTVVFTADEAVEGYRVSSVAECPCRD